MSYYTSRFQDEVIAAVVNLRLEHLHANHTGKPQVAHYFTREEMLDQHFTLGGIEAVVASCHR
jgi:hypothetical protein